MADIDSLKAEYKSNLVQCMQRVKTELKRQSIYLVALGKRKQYKGFDFKYV